MPPHWQRRYTPTYTVSAVWKESRRRYGVTDFFVQKLPFNLYMKRGACAFQEVAALILRLVQQHVTMIPVSFKFVLDIYWLDTGRVGKYFKFIMAGLRGEPLGTKCNQMRCVNRSQNSYINFMPYRTMLRVLCRAHTTTCRAATSTDWTSFFGR